MLCWLQFLLISSTYPIACPGIQGQRYYCLPRWTSEFIHRRFPIDRTSVGLIVTIMKSEYLIGSLLGAVTVNGAAVRRSLPVVDLGYAIHQGTINVKELPNGRQQNSFTDTIRQLVHTTTFQISDMESLQSDLCDSLLRKHLKDETPLSTTDSDQLSVLSQIQVNVLVCQMLNTSNSN